MEPNHWQNYWPNQIADGLAPVRVVTSVGGGVNGDVGQGGRNTLLACG